MAEQDADRGLGPCGLCGRPLVPGPSINKHHLVPRYDHTFDRLLTHEQILAFVKWVRKKDPEMYSRNRTTRAKRQR